MERREVSFSKKGGGGRCGFYKGHRAAEVKLPAPWWLLFSHQRRKHACGHVQEVRNDNGYRMAGKAAAGTHRGPAGTTGSQGVRFLPCSSSLKTWYRRRNTALIQNSALNFLSSPFCCACMCVCTCAHAYPCACSLCIQVIILREYTCTICM